ncbi:MAG TPA: alkaline phosphatase family protein [Anaerolineales bacterium]|nr:alkaline phosphatase family protein [Anaerolineales bacterium]
MNKVILVLSDGLRYDTAAASMGYLVHLVEAKLASLYRVTGELPSMSRPMYETIHTGLPVSIHGIVANQVIRASTKPNIFQLASAAGKTTAAAAYFWFSELYNRCPYDPVDDWEVDDDSLPIQHGRFYTQNEFPDIDLFATAGLLVRKFDPDYLLVHPMGMDNTGETFGADSKEYRNHAIRQDRWLSTHLTEWMERGYHILVTADHGINADGLHGGTTPDVRDVPLYFICPDLPGKGQIHEPISQLQIAPTICRLLELEIPETMKAAPLV